MQTYSCNYVGVLIANVIVWHKQQLYFVVSLAKTGIYLGAMWYLADPGKARGCSTNTFVIDSFSWRWFVKISLPRRHALMVADGAFSHKCYNFLGNSKSHYWFKSYGDFAKWVDFAYWWSFIGKGLCLHINIYFIHGHMFSGLCREKKNLSGIESKGGWRGWGAERNTLH